VLGLTFKENVPDVRNSRSFDIIRRLQWIGYHVTVADPLADPAEIAAQHGLELAEPNGSRFDLVIGAVAHDAYRQMSDQEIAAIVSADGIVADLKGMWRDRRLPDNLDRWSL
jgi:UDP-N-acetyl-D-galactosamine dehydrogenase